MSMGHNIFTKMRDAIHRGLGLALESGDTFTITGDTDVVGAVTASSVVSVGDIDGGSYIRSTSPTSGLGYATGAGGSVTQGTGSANFATAVTLVKVCGQITTATAATGTQELAAGATAEFQVNCTTPLDATDVVVVSVATQFATSGPVQVYVKNNTGSAFTLRMTNMNGVTAINTGSGAAVINYAIIKAVAA